MEPNDRLRVERMFLAAQSRTLRSLEQTAKRRARKYNTGNYPTWQERREGYYQQRLALRSVSRYLGLVNALVKGRDYRSVENQVREGNEVEVDLLLEELNAWGFTPPKAHVKEWLTA